MIVEDGSISFGIGSEILSMLVENKVQLDFALRVGAEPVPIPSTLNLELEVLPTINRIIGLIQLNERGALND